MLPAPSVSQRPRPVPTPETLRSTGPRELERRRADIDHVDRALVRLLNLRARLALRTAELKRRTGTALRAPRREREVLESVADASLGPLDRRAVLAVFRAIIRESRRLEEDQFRAAP